MASGAPFIAPWKDRRGAKRTVPMKVLVLGFCRTGTASMRVALETLGYCDTHHMQAVLYNPPEVDMWREAIDAKFFGKGKPYGRPEWDQLLGHCQAITDVPAILFADELITAYPEAKVVLTNRDPAKWWKSYTESLQTMYRSKRVRVAGWFDPWHFGKEEKSKTRFVQHYESVRKMVPKQRLLEYEVGEGWDRLCAFLGKDVPDTQFPHVNDTKTITQNINMWAAVIFRRAAFRFAVPAALFMSSLGIYFQKTRRT
ncbi:P-loop containing nucleoside triphosphate hydrolase protein [Mycena olivaceomarginata]|nr:P-loop containing nucleoside triphosphate hydrolase protein [Mycena olivaceomarginata]